MKKNEIQLGNKVKITPLGSHGQAVGGKQKNKNPTYEGKVDGIYPNFFIVNNGVWKESFNFRDIGIQGGIQVTKA